MLGQLQSLIIGEYEDKTDPENVVRQKLAFNQVNSALLRILYAPDKHKKGDATDGTSDSDKSDFPDDFKEFNVSIVGGVISSASKAQTINLSDQDLLTYSLIKNTHTLFRNNLGLFVVSGSLS